MTKATTFLLVEDDPNDVFFVEHAFQEAPAHIKFRHAWDGADAIRYLTGVGKFSNRTEYPLPDVILLDLKMRGMGGFEFLEWLRKTAPADLRVVPVIVMSSSAMRSDVERAYQLGVSAYVTKPVDFEAFKERVKLLGIFWAAHAETPQTRT